MIPPSRPPGWFPDQESLVSEILEASEGEEALVTGGAPLLRLLNDISGRVFNSIIVNSTKRDALVFYFARKFKINHVSEIQNCTPTNVAEGSHVFSAVKGQLDSP